MVFQYGGYDAVCSRIILLLILDPVYGTVRKSSNGSVGYCFCHEARGTRHETLGTKHETRDMRHDLSSIFHNEWGDIGWYHTIPG